MRIKTLASAAILTLSTAALAGGIGGGQAMNTMVMNDATMNDTTANDTMANDMLPAADNTTVAPVDGATTTTPDSGMDDAPPK